MSYPDNSITQTVTIAAGASLSGASVKYPGYRLFAVITASTWDAAKIAFQGTVDGTNFFVVKPEGVEYECAAVTGAALVPIDPKHFVALDAIKVQSGISTAATNQVDATIVTLVFMPF
jgi:hypothetical protein